MSKTLTFIVTVAFAEKVVSDEEIKEVANNLARAVRNEANGEGFAPSESDNYTVGVKVVPQYLPDYVIDENFIK
jgi:hypothetical protein